MGTPASSGSPITPRISLPTSFSWSCRRSAARVDAGDATAVLESVKSVADVYAPVAGEVVEINKALEEHPEYVNESPYDNGWIFKLKANSGDASHLLDAKGYQKFLDAQEH